MDIAIVAVAYNKKNSLLRLLDSLNSADYENDKVPLIISIDHSGNDDVIDAARRFEWRHGKKEIRIFHKRQGLKQHILSCGDFLEQYNALFVFEDDIFVSPQYYRFGKMCIDYYKDDAGIEGISLYSMKWNQNANFPFEPLKTEYDTYFFQYAQSWGQIWFRDNWKKFKQWYLRNTDFFERKKRKDIPANLYTWGNHSWLKYYMVYCILHNKYFVYPYYSFTTSFVEKGTNFATDITRFHSDMMIDDISHYRLAPYSEEALHYDAFYENELLKKKQNERTGKNVLLDLYGQREVDDNVPYMLTTQILPYKICREYALQLKPIELNVLMEMEGCGIYLYDTRKEDKVRKSIKRKQIDRIWNYFMNDRFMMWHEIGSVSVEKLTNLVRIGRKICAVKIENLK